MPDVIASYGRLFDLYVFATSKKGPRPKWNKHESDKNNKCLSVGSLKILYVCLLLSLAYLQRMWSPETLTGYTVYYPRLS